MSKKIEKNYYFNSRKFQLHRSEYYKYHPMLLPDVRNKVSIGVRAFNISKGLKEIICGCGMNTGKSSSNQSIKKYIDGHHIKKQIDIKIPFVCGCGCELGGMVKISKKKDKNYIHGHNRADPNLLSSIAKNRLALMSSEQRSIRTKNSMGKADQVLRAKAIKEGKSSIMRAILSDGTYVDFKSTEIPTEFKITYDKMKYAIKRSSGIHAQSPGIKFEYVKKYAGGNKWKT